LDPLVITMPAPGEGAVQGRDRGEAIDVRGQGGNEGERILGESIAKEEGGNFSRGGDKVDCTHRKGMLIDRIRRGCRKGQLHLRRAPSCRLTRPKKAN